MRYDEPWLNLEFLMSELKDIDLEGLSRAEEMERSLYFRIPMPIKIDMINLSRLLWGGSRIPICGRIIPVGIPIMIGNETPRIMYFSLFFRSLSSDLIYFERKMIKP